MSVFILKIFDMSRGQVICFNFWSGLILHATTATQVRTHSGVRTPLLELLCLNFSFKFWPSTVKRSISPFLTCHIFPSRVTIKKILTPAYVTIQRVNRSSTWHQSNYINLPPLSASSLISHISTNKTDTQQLTAKQRFKILFNLFFLCEWREWFSKMATSLPEIQQCGEGVVLSKSAKRVDSKGGLESEEEDTKSPILIFLYFHKAIRNELDTLHLLTLAFATGHQTVEIKPLFQRYRFLRLVYKYHSNAEDEVCLFWIFLFNFCFVLFVFTVILFSVWRIILCFKIRKREQSKSIILIFASFVFAVLYILWFF